MDGFSDLAFFGLLMKKGSLTAAAQEMGVTPPSISKRLAALEARLGVRLLQRTTRRIGLTPEGETYLAEGTRVLAELDALERAVAGAKLAPRGPLRVAATLGFGRRQVAPALSRFARKYPDVQVQLHLTDRPVKLVEHAFDVSVQIGEPPDGRLTARLLARNGRLLCAAPSYLQRAGEPKHPRDLARHACVVIRENDETFGTWHLRRGARHETVKVHGAPSTNDGECALAWALDGHGIVMRSHWDVAPYIRSRRLRPVLAEWTLPAADVYLLFATKAHLLPKTRAVVDFLGDWFEDHRRTKTDALGNW